MLPPQSARPGMKQNPAKRGQGTAAKAYKDTPWQDTMHWYGPKYSEIQIHLELVKCGKAMEVI